METNIYTVIVSDEALEVLKACRDKALHTYETLDNVERPHMLQGGLSAWSERKDAAFDEYNHLSCIIESAESGKHSPKFQDAAKAALGQVHPNIYGGQS